MHHVFVLQRRKGGKPCAVKLQDHPVRVICRPESCEVIVQGYGQGAPGPAIQNSQSTATSLIRPARARPKLCQGRVTKFPNHWSAPQLHASTRLSRALRRSLHEALQLPVATWPSKRSAGTTVTITPLQLFASPLQTYHLPRTPCI
jgi:hypothetical protein